MRHSYLSLISDEVDFWFAWLSWCCSWDGNFRCFFRFLNQNIDQSLFFVLWLQWNYWCSWCWCTRCFDENDFVMFLGLSNMNWSLWSEFFWFWWRNMYVDVFLDCGATSETTSKSTSESTTSSATASKSTTSSAAASETTAASETSSNTTAKSCKQKSSFSC